MKKNQGEDGQATLEFALTLMMLLGFTFFFLQLSMIFAWGNYVHYATFMSARAYLSAGSNPEDQQERARTVIIQMLKQGAASPRLDRLPTIARGVGEGDPAGFQVEAPGEFKPKARDFSWLEGVRYTFRSKLFPIPLPSLVAPNKKGNGKDSWNTVTLTSESWLGREPSYSECRAYLSKKSGGRAGAAFLFDNGC